MGIVTNEINQIRNVWKEAWNSTYAFNLLLVAIIGFVMLVYVPQYFIYVQNRAGVVLEDKLLDWLPSIDLSWYIFPIIHISMILLLINLSYYPEMLMVGLQTYLLVTLARLTCIYFVPLEPPLGIVLLTDPVNERVFYGNTIITKDLFFSGHTATQFLLFMLVQNKILKFFFLGLVILLGIMILIQHVHYTIDVIAAPVVVWICYRTVYGINKKYLKGLNN
jgi:hypothetical protein